MRRVGVGRGLDRGIAIMLVAIVVFSSASSLVKWSDSPGPAIAFWRMLGASVAWWIVVPLRRVTTGRPIPTLTTWRRVLPAGLCFGANITVFFAAINHTSVTHAEFILSLCPLLLVPLGAVLFHERPNLRALPFGLVTLAGLAIVLMNGPDDSGSSLRGDLVIVGSLGTWVAYLVLGRRARASVEVVDFMATLMPIGLLVAAPAAAIQAGGDLWPLDARGWAAVVMLSILTGMIGHGLIALAQRELDVGTISVIQVAQPAIAVCWAMVILGERVAPMQIPGMALVVAGLVGFTLLQQRRDARAPAVTVEVAPAVCPRPLAGD